jgi:hypothetical protein
MRTSRQHRYNDAATYYLGKIEHAFDRIAKRLRDPSGRDRLFHAADARAPDASSFAVSRVPRCHCLLVIFFTAPFSCDALDSDESIGRRLRLFFHSSCIHRGSVSRALRPDV